MLKHITEEMRWHDALFLIVAFAPVTWLWLFPQTIIKSVGNWIPSIYMLLLILLFIPRLNKYLTDQKNESKI